MKRPEPIKRFRKYMNKRRRPAIQEIVREVSSGGVVFRRNKKGEVEILMIQDSKDRWSLPKGQVKGEETLKQTAEREIKEETGLQDMEVMNWLGKVQFRYRRKNSLVLKTMHVYLVRAIGDTAKIQTEDVDWITKVKWFPTSEALEKVEYDDIGKLILLGMKKIRQAKL
jgi:diadenosine hexaphosphate hydrolase (ATP-forming)